MRSWTTLILLTLAQPVQAAPACMQESPPHPPPGSCATLPAIPKVEAWPSTPYGCAQSRVFFVDFPVLGEVPQDHFAWDLAGWMESWATPWAAGFCPEYECAPRCPGHFGASILVDVAPVLPPRGTGLRGTGHLRHFQISFFFLSADRPPELIDVPPDMQCEVIAELRLAATTIAKQHGVNTKTRGDMRIGRQSCNIAPMAAGWHLAQMDVAPTSFIGPWVDIALIDSGVFPALHGPLGVRTEGSSLESPSIENPPGQHAHGTAMAELIRQLVDPSGANLDSYVAINRHGQGVIADATRAIDAALARPSSRPLVINLSLGWLPEFSRRRYLNTDTCATGEDGVGESMRYILTVARQEDTAARPVMVVSSAGNRPLSSETPEAFWVDQSANYDSDTTGWWSSGRKPMLLPAEWSRTHQGPPLTLAVGAVDADGERGALSIMPPETEPYLVAPGEHVHSPAAASLDPTLSPFVTGSSVSAALVSGLAARALARLEERRDAGDAIRRVSGDLLGHLLYLAGVDLGRSTWDGLAVRRVHAVRQDLLVTCPAPLLDDLLGCIESKADLGLGHIVTHCKSLATACGVPEQSAVSNRPPGDLPYWQGNPPTCNHYHSVTAQKAITSNDRWEDPWGTPLWFGSEDPSDPIKLLEQEVLGALGPQPTGAGCSDCSMKMNSVGDTTVNLRFSTKYPAGTRILNPTLLVTTSSGDELHVPITPASKQAHFAPGYTAEVTGIQVPKAYLPVKKAKVVITVEQPAKHRALSTSPLWLAK